MIRAAIPVLVLFFVSFFLVPTASATHFVLEKDYKVKGSEYLEDIDRDGHAEVLVLNLTINCTGTGDYVVTGALYSLDGQEIDTTGTSVHLTQGEGYVLLKFSTRKMAERRTKESYVLRYVKIVNEMGIEEDYRYQAYTTKEYDYRDLFPLPDLVARITRPEWSRTGRVQVEGEIENVGTTTVNTTACFYSVFSTGELLSRGCEQVTNLEPGTILPVKRNVTILSPGVHHFLLSVPLEDDLTPENNNGTGEVIVMGTRNITFKASNPWGTEKPGVTLSIPGTDISYDLVEGSTIEIMDPTTAGLPATMEIEREDGDTLIETEYNLTTLPDTIEAGAGWSTERDLGDLVVHYGMAVAIGNFGSSIASTTVIASFSSIEHARNPGELGLYVCDTVPSEGMECSTGWKRVIDMDCSSFPCNISVMLKYPVWGVAIAEPEYCGNGYCAASESEESCPRDCGAVATIEVNETPGSVIISGLQPGVAIERNVTSIPFLYRVAVSTAKSAQTNETLTIRLLEDYQDYEPYTTGTEEFYPLVLVSVDSRNNTRPSVVLHYIVPQEVVDKIGVGLEDVGFYAYDGLWSPIAATVTMGNGFVELEASVVPGYAYALGAAGSHEEQKTILERIVDWFSFLWEEKEEEKPADQKSEAEEKNKQVNLTTWQEFFENRSTVYNWSEYEPPVKAKPRVWSPEGGASMFIIKVMLGVLGILVGAMIYMRYGGAIKDKILGIDQTLKEARREQKKKKTTTYKKIVDLRKEVENLKDVIAQYSSSVDFDAMDWDERIEDIYGLLQEAEDFLELGNEEKAQLRVRQAEEKILVLKHEIYAALA